MERHTLKSALVIMSTIRYVFLTFRFEFQNSNSLPLTLNKPELSSKFHSKLLSLSLSL
jgi:hypothetical protein